jgi:hypothetical protein
MAVQSLQQALCADTERSVTIVPVGSKGSAPLRRNVPERLEAIVRDYGKNTINFAVVRAGTARSRCAHLVVVLNVTMPYVYPAVRGATKLHAPQLS